MLGAFSLLLYGEFAELLFEFKMRRADTLQQPVEFGAMVQVAQVAEFVQDDVVPKMWWKEMEADIEIYIPLCGA